jgi:hypothetical protein
MALASDVMRFGLHQDLRTIRPDFRCSTPRSTGARAAARAPLRVYSMRVSSYGKAGPLQSLKVRDQKVEILTPDAGDVVEGDRDAAGPFQIHSERGRGPVRQARFRGGVILVNAINRPRVYAGTWAFPPPRSLRPRCPFPRTASWCGPPPALTTAIPRCVCDCGPGHDVRPEGHIGRRMPIRNDRRLIRKFPNVAARTGSADWRET